jgi:protein-tyrosine phosphatase
VAERTISWDGCVNVRDLGGLPTEDGRTTRFRVVVRADDVSALSQSGWNALVEYGVRRIVDLRHEDPPYEAPVEVVRVPLLDPASIVEIDRLLLGVDDPSEWRSRQYLFFLERSRPNFARAAAAVAETNGTVLVHCAGGVDRTGLVAGLLLRLAGVAVDAIARDYAESEANWAASVEEWIGAAPNDVERRKRRLLAVMPAAAMRDALSALEEAHGSVLDYLVEGGAPAAALEGIARRLRA